MKISLTAAAFFFNPAVRLKNSLTEMLKAKKKPLKPPLNNGLVTL
jgi:hypothetical protein